MELRQRAHPYALEPARIVPVPLREVPKLYREAATDHQTCKHCNLQWEQGS